MTLAKQAARLQARLSEPRTEVDTAALRALMSAIGGTLSGESRKKLVPCPKCGAMCGVREMRYDHPKACTARSDA